MPRRRTTAPRKRAQTVVEDDVTEKEIDPDDKNVKVDLLLRDFDKGVEMRLKELEAAHKRILKNMTWNYQRLYKKFTKEELNMSVSEYLDSLGRDKSDSSVPDEISNAVNSDQEEEEDEYNSKIMQTVLKKKERRNVLGVISEENAPATVTRKRTVANRMEPPSTVVRNKFQTPGVGRSRAGWETPMVTPKFDPRLPVTTARKLKRGESALTSVFMSGRGSPVHATQPLLTIPTSNNPNQGVSILGNETLETIKEMYDGFDPRMKENLKKMAKMMSMLTEDH